MKNIVENNKFIGKMYGEMMKLMAIHAGVSLSHSDMDTPVEN